MERIGDPGFFLGPWKTGQWYKPTGFRKTAVDYVFSVCDLAASSFSAFCWSLNGVMLGCPPSQDAIVANEGLVRDSY